MVNFQRNQVISLNGMSTLDTIHAAMKEQGLAERFGFNLLTAKKEKPNGKLVEEYQLWEYDTNSGDWLQEDHESILTGYNPSY